MFLELLGLGKKCEQRITEALTELFWQFCSVIWAEEYRTEIVLEFKFGLVFVCNGITSKVSTAITHGSKSFLQRSGPCVSCHSNQRVHP